MSVAYQEILKYLFSRLPMFQRIGAAAYKADLNNTIKLCHILHNPEHDFPSVHIAGTNGKGSVSNMVASVLQEAGFKTGLFTSPHLKDFRERIRIDGKMIPEEFIIGFVEKHRAAFEPVGASFFEYTFAVAMQYFSEQNIDIAVIETGMGGRLDSTNVVRSVVAAITNISLDHTAFLGDSTEKIAMEKAGIIKQNIPVVIGETQREIMDVFINKSLQEEAPISFADQNFTAHFDMEGRLNILHNGKSYLARIRFPLQGHYQEKNVATVLEIITILKQKGYRITKKNIKSGLEHIVKNTGFSGRWQILGNTPLIICDTGHNKSGIAATMQQLHGIPHQKLHIVLGMVNDKDFSKILSLFPKNAVYYFCKAAIPRGLDASILQKEAEKYGLHGTVYASVKKAFRAAQRDAGNHDVIYVGGSTFTVAEVI